MMFIMTVGRSYPEKKTGMAGVFEFEQAKALSEIGNKVVYAFSDNRSIKVIRSLKPIRKKNGNVEIYGRQFPAKGLPKAVVNKIKTNEYKELMKVITDEQGIPDVIHIHFPLLTLTREIFDYFRELKCKIVCTEHWSKVQKKELSAEKTELLKYIVERSDSFICVGEQLKKSVVELTGTKKEIYVVPNMVSEQFEYCRKTEDNGKFTFIAVGRLVPEKGFNVVIDAFAKAFPDNDNIFLNIVGDGKCRKKLEKQIASTNVSDRIIMSGFKNHNEIADMYAGADCYVSASVFETFGVPFIEAWVTGLPSIGTKGGSIDEYFTNENGLLFEKDNTDDLVRAMKSVYSNKDAYVGKNISETAGSLFSSKKVAERLVKIFEL